MFAEWMDAMTLITSGASLWDISEALSKLGNEMTEKLCMRRLNGHYLWDLLHFSIYAKRADVVDYMFKEDLFLKSYSTDTNKMSAEKLPYLHMACVCGNEDIVEMIMFYRPQEKKMVIYTESLYWTSFMDTIRKGNKPHSQPVHLGFLGLILS